MQTKLISAILTQVRLFLEDADEFYPFATAVDTSEKIVPIGVHTGDEYPRSNELIDFLEEHIQNSLKQHRFILAAIAVDSWINKCGDKNNAVEIRVFDEVGVSKVHYRYFKENGVISFQGIAPL